MDDKNGGVPANLRSIGSALHQANAPALNRAGPWFRDDAATPSTGDGPMTPDIPDPDDLTDDDVVRDRLSHVEVGDELTVHLRDGRDLAGEVREVEETPPHEDHPPERELVFDLDGEGYQLTFDPRASHGGPVDLYRVDQETFGDPVGEVGGVTVGDRED